jgi:hypothetical protein
MNLDSGLPLTKSKIPMPDVKPPLESYGGINDGIIKGAERYSDLWCLTKELLEALDYDHESAPDYIRKTVERHGLFEDDDE